MHSIEVVSEMPLVDEVYRINQLSRREHKARKWKIESSIGGLLKVAGTLAREKLQ
jgi:hypothetical protein